MESSQPIVFSDINEASQEGFENQENEPKNGQRSEDQDPSDLVVVSGELEANKGYN